MRAEERLTPQVVEAIREYIADADGNEVYMVGRVGADGRVEEVKVGARGTEEQVLVLVPHLSGGDVIIHNHPSGGTRPSGADMVVAARWGNEGVGFYILDNSVESIYVVAEPVEQAQRASLDLDELAGHLTPGGTLSRLYPLYEERKSQIGMLRLVCKAFNGDELCAAEAGTGVGKSLAYLLPAIAWAIRNKERVVVSTNTINLQQQLLDKDIPLVKRILGEDPKVVLVKGRRNYLCLHRLNESLDEMSLFEERDSEILAIKEWSRTTETGSRTDLSFYPKEESWSRVCSEADACLGLRCAHREGCFVLKARREAASAQVLVANHHLLFSDLAFRLAASSFDDPAVLPPFRRVIFDEAHNIEKAATSFFSQSFSRFSLLKFLGRLYRRAPGPRADGGADKGPRGRARGHLVALSRVLGRNTVTGKAPRLAEDVREKAEALDAACRELLTEESAVLLDSQSLPAFIDHAGPALRELAGAIRGLEDLCAEIFDKVSQKDPTKDIQNMVWDCRVQLARLTGIADLCDRFRTAETGLNDIFWMESIKGESIRFVVTPLDIGPLMREAVFEPIKTAVFTSATLTVAGNFDYWAGRIGLDNPGEKEPLYQTFPSPFNYRENVLLGVPTDAPPPDSPKYKRFLSDFITRALTSSRGAGLVLFTSYALLRETYAEVQPALAARGIRILRQGDDERSRLLDAFRAERSSVLFATDSFWEGVDVPGETLQMVILCRLPFRVPTEPVLKARMAAIEMRGGNPFGELSLPDAVVRLRQGFGRLMRRNDDRGVVLILDSRIVTKSYGSIFLESLPKTEKVMDRAEAVQAAVAAFFA
ncbi:MAG: helicase C-terminal domain-containing protein [Spirochaetia bacterium]